jgi:two-component system sensor histidine kinase QseC
MTPQRSLFRRLLGGFLAVVTAIWLGVVAMAVYENVVLQARHTAAENRGWVRQILLNLRSVATDPAEVARVATQVEALRADMLREVDYWPKPVMLQVWLHGERVYRSRDDLPDGLALPSPDAPPLGARWSTHTARDAATSLVVRRDAMHDTNWLLSGSGAAYYLAPLLYSLPFLMLPAWIIVRRGLAPVNDIVADIERRSGHELQLLAPTGYRELAPLVASVNGLIGRLTERVERDRQFLADAAHELKTPLSVIRANAHLLLQPRDASHRLHDADRGLRQGVARATHTVHQLLALERARGDDAPPQPLDLARLVQERLAHAATDALARAVEIGFDGPSHCTLPLHRDSVVALLDNLIDNAVKYSPDGGEVAVTLTDAPDCVLAIVDEGPGIPAALRKRVFERFYRVAGQEQPGSGLGLAIAARAAARNCAAIVLGDGDNGHGLRATVRFGAASNSPLAE